ncbi:uncharacterized protein LOC107218477 isoform X1 [Neodiprion lecontei]|uniref:Gustatory receptor n=2 Tax=Neodiprion lecontei TaxID=441921 RepID=A0ABM3GLN3_NEOLC|nr:uncharacterized protein LOC107218477 isoform X1 [Neodiprion lecontei]XP_046601173.1 uncharacterized protein LOC107218477 isoform X1 [Neodiprion lecontei]
MAQTSDAGNISPTALVMYKALVYTNSSVTVMTPIIIWLRSKTLTASFKEMMIIDNSFETILESRNQYTKRYIELLVEVISIFLFVFGVGVCDIVWTRIWGMVDNQSIQSIWGTLATLHHPILLTLILDVNFCTFVRYMEKQFEDLNIGILKLTIEPDCADSSKRPELQMYSRNFTVTKSVPEDENAAKRLVKDKYYVIQKIRKTHLSLTRLTKKMNTAFGVQNLLSVTESFVMITGLSYTIYSTFSSKTFNYYKLKEIISPTAWTLIYGYKIWIICHACYKVTTEMQRTGQVIYDLLGKKVDTELQKEIREFSLQMLQNPVSFDVCGLVTLDHSFLQQVIEFFNGFIHSYIFLCALFALNNR